MREIRIKWFVCLLVFVPTSAAQTPTAPSSKKNVDIYGDPLPPNAVARLGTVRWRHPETILAMEFGKDDKTLISVGDRSIRVWEVATGKLVRRIDYRKENDWLLHPTRCAGISPDRQTIAVAWSGGLERPGNVITLWNVQLGTIRKSIREKNDEFPSGMVAALAFSPDGQILATRYYRSTDVRIWKTSNCELIGECRKPEDNDEWYGGIIQCKPLTLAFSIDGTKILSISEPGSMTVWDVQRRKAIWQNKKKNACLIAANTHGNSFAVLRDDGIVIAQHLEKVYGKPKIEITDNNGNYNSLVHHTSFLAHGSYWSDRIRVWDVRTTKLIWRSEILNESVDYLAISAEGNKLAASVGVSIRLWDMKTGKEIGPQCGHVGWLSNLAISPDGKSIVTQAGNGKLRAWNLSSRRQIWLADNSCFDVRSKLLFSPDGKSIASLGPTSTGRKVAGYPIAEPQIRDVATGRLVKRFIVPLLKPVRAINSSGKAGSSDPEQFPNSGSILNENSLHDLCISLIAFAADGKTLMSHQAGDIIYHWDAANGKLRRQTPLRLDSVGSLECLSATGTRAAFFRSRTVPPNFSAKPLPNSITIHDFSTKRTLSRFEPSDPPFFAWDFTPDGRSLVFSVKHGFVAAKADRFNLIYIIESQTGTIRRLFKAKEADNDIRVTAFSPDSRLLASACYGWIRLWDVITGKQITRFRAHDGAIMDLTFSADNKLLLTASQDTTVMLWDVAKLTKNHKKKKTTRLTPKQLHSCWQTLAGDDASKAYDAIWTLVADPAQSVPFLKKRLAPATFDPQRVRLLLDKLGSSKFAEREKAAKELEEMGEWMLPFLRKRLSKSSNLEVHRRIKALIRKAEDRPLPANEIRSLRAVEVLEHIGGDDAISIIRRLAKGFDAARLSRDAEAALQRLTNRAR